ncbi:MAG: glycosyltransferase family 4 protein [Candidatus Limnocylindria bacterium]
MRIAFIYDALYPYVAGGAERRYHELARRLTTSHDVHYITWQWWDGPSVTQSDAITLHGVGTPPALYGTDGKRRVREAASFAARIVPVLLNQRWDVVDCSATPYLPLYSAWAATRVTRTPLVATWHEYWGDHWLDYLPHRPLVARTARALEAGARLLGDRVVGVSPFTLGRMGAAPRSGDLVVPNGVDLAAYSDTSDGIESRGWDVAYVGRLIDEKRVDLLLGAIAQVRERRPALRCAIVGDGPARAQLEASAAARGVSDNVRFLGHLEERSAIDVLRASMLFVLPSAREGFGITVVEAMACSAVPIVVRGPHTAAPALVDHGVDGLVCDPTARAIADSIEELLSQSDRLRDMQLSARRTAERFAWDAVTLEMEGVYLAVGQPRVAVATA